MMRTLLLVPLLLATGVALADEPPATEQPVPPAEEKGKANGGAKMISGMSILGNQEAPKSLVIVPWKGSEIGDSLDISTMLSDTRRPVDRDVFMRALTYYEIRSGKTP